MSLNLALSTALSGLLTSQRGLDVVSSNITNVNTEGYSRKIFNAESVVLAGKGAGVQAGNITRQVEQGLQDDMREAKGLYSSLALTNDYMERIQDIFGTPDGNNSLSHVINDLAEQFELLALETDKGPQADEVINAGSDLANKLNRMTQQIQDLRTDADRQIAAGVNQINSILGSIDSLNDKISLASATNGAVADLQDKRDVQLNALAQLIDISYYERESGAISVFTTSGVTLVDAEPNYLSHTALSSVQAWDSAGGGDFDAITSSGQDITGDIRSGKLKGLLDMRDGELVNLQGQIDELSQTMIDKVNQVHNRGTSFPNMNSSYNGSRTFVDSANQRISINDGTADTAIVIFNSDGTQKAATTLREIIGDTINGGAASGGPITIDDLATNLTSWLNNANGGGMTGASASVDANGHFSISLNSSGYGLTFRDQVSSVPGDDTADLPIAFDPTNSGGAFQTYSTDSGFANFLGLNDFFSTGGENNWMWETPVQAANYTQIGSSVMNFVTTDESGVVQNHTITLANGDTLQDIANRINNDTVLQGKFELRASVVNEGSGVRLRLSNISGNEMSITGNSATDSYFSTLGLKAAATGTSAHISVDSDVELNPTLVSRGTTQYNSDTGEFYLSAGDNTNASQMASLFTSVQSFDSAGGLTTGNLVFSDYASSIISGASNRAATVESNLSYQTTLADSLELKNAEISAVNLDEELSQLMIYQQSYSAAAKVISTTQQMFDILNDII
jgi:flagellar hook-associated protein 1 FlgK